MLHGKVYYSFYFQVVVASPANMEVDMGKEIIGVASGPMDSVFPVIMLHVELDI
jgi:hypothetical protein